MNDAKALTVSDAFYIKDSQTNPIEPQTMNEITQERIESFFEDPSVVTDEKKADRNKRDTMSQSMTRKDKTPPLAFVPRTDYHPRTFSSLQRWEGYVVEVHEEYFVARITDLDEEHEDEEIEVMYTDISEDDMKLIRPGAIFNWHIGYSIQK